MAAMSQRDDGDPAAVVDRLADTCVATLLEPDPDMAVLEGGVADRNDLDSDTLQRTIYDAVLLVNRRLFPPVSKLELLLAEGCNMACYYCFESAVLQSGGRRIRAMSADTIRRSVDLLFDYAAPGEELSITLFGGEPMVNFAGLKFATEYAERRGAEAGHTVGFNMTTNGLLLNDKNLGFIANHKIKVLLSVDGLAGSHDRYRVDKKGDGTFRRVIENVVKLKRRQPWVGVKMTVMPSEAGKLFENVCGLRDLGVNQFLIGHATGSEWTERDIRVFIEQMERLKQWYRACKGNDLRINEFDEPPTRRPVFACSAAHNTVAVTAAGDISGCSRIATLEKDVVVGKLGDVRFGLYCLRNRMEMVAGDRLRTNCERTGLIDDYRDGCFAVNYESSKDLYAPSRVENDISARLARVYQ